MTFPLFVVKEKDPAAVIPLRLYGDGAESHRLLALLDGACAREENTHMRC